ncbi:MAG: ScyD/ScyE family protein [Saprospiraceae bacterium]
MKFLLLSLLLLGGGLLHAQNYTVMADSLRLPVGLEAAAGGNLWVVESGYGFNDGAVSLLESDGTILPVIVGLPAFFDTTTHENVGAWHTLILPNNRLAVMSAASGQLAIFDLTGFQPGVNPPMTLANSVAAFNIAEFALGNGFMESDPYSVAVDAAQNYYVADAAANAIIKVTPAGVMSVFATFPPFPNPLPFGPPVIDAVPTRILAKPGGGFYVCTLTGFPFLDGAAAVYTVDGTGSVTPYATGLTQVTDLALDANTGDLYALQIGHFDLMGMPPGYAPNSAKVTRIKTDGSRETAAEGFDLSAGMTLDGQGNLYVSELGKGRVLKINGVASGISEKKEVVESFRLSPNPSQGSTRIVFTLKAATSVDLRILSADGRLVFNRQLADLPAGSHQTEWLSGDQKSGLYWVELQTDRGVETRKLVIR